MAFKSRRVLKMCLKIHKHLTKTVLKFRTFFSVCSQRFGTHKMLVRIANREDPDQTAFSTGHLCSKL